MGECLITRRGGEPYKLPVLNESYPADSTVTSGTDATFSVDFVEHGKPAIYTYQWYVNGNSIGGANSANYTRNTSADKGQYTVYCEVGNRSGVITSRQATMTVNKSPVLNGNYPANVTVNKGTNATFTVSVSDAGYPESYTYQWYVNGNAVSGATGATYTRNTSSDKGNYSVYCCVTNSAGTVTSRTATMNVQYAIVPNTSLSWSNSTFSTESTSSASTSAGSGSTTFNIINRTDWTNPDWITRYTHIDTTGYSKMTLVGTVSWTGNGDNFDSVIQCGFGVGNMTLAVGYSQGFNHGTSGSLAINGTYDISSLSGSQAFGVTVYDWSSTPSNVTITITKCILSV